MLKFELIEKRKNQISWKKSMSLLTYNLSTYKLDRQTLSDKLSRTYKR